MSLDHKHATAATQWAVQVARDHLNAVGIANYPRIGIEVHHTVLDVTLHRLLTVVTTSALPGTFLLVVRNFRTSSAAKYRSRISNVLRLLVLLSFVGQQFDIQDFWFGALVMVSFDVFQRALDRYANSAGRLDHPSKDASVGETRSTQNHASTLDISSRQTPVIKANDSRTSPKSVVGASNTVSNAIDLKEKEIVRLQRALTESKTATKAKEVLLRSTQEELKNARGTLNETFAEYSGLRDEMKAIKQNLSRDHQAVVYRKDIELFALRKINEHKERYIQAHNAKADELYQQQKATAELKDAQLKMLQERLTTLECQGSPDSGHEEVADGDHALEVRLLRVRKGKQPGSEKERDATIAKLEEQLASATKSAEAVVGQHAELQRAWDVAKKVQAALESERESHTQTKDRLLEMEVKMEEESQSRSQPTSGTRLPTIEEDKNELEAMFDTAQEDNLRLYAEVEALEKRLRDANARMFTAVQEVEALREQIKVEKAISRDYETARPSVVHRVHFQRMEGLLQESRDLLATKNEEVCLLKSTIVGKNHYIKDLQAEVNAAVKFHTQDQDEIESLKKSFAELQATKAQLMREHEGLASQRVRQRVSSAEHASARSSGATLTTGAQDTRPQVVQSSDGAAPAPAPTSPPAPVEPSLLTPSLPTETARNDSIQTTPKRHLRNVSTPNRWSLMSSDAPPPELRHNRRRSSGLKEFMKKIVKKDSKHDTSPPAPAKVEKLSERPQTRAALSTKDRNAMLRPQTAAATKETKPIEDPFYTVPTPPREVQPRSSSPRYYAAPPEVRPSTAASAAKTSRDDSEVSRPGSRRSWGAA
jgi:hypothetical protein